MKNELFLREIMNEIWNNHVLKKLNNMFIQYIQFILTLPILGKGKL